MLVHIYTGGGERRGEGVTPHSARSSTSARPWWRRNPAGHQHRCSGPAPLTQPSNPCRARLVAPGKPTRRHHSHSRSRTCPSSRQQTPARRPTPAGVGGGMGSDGESDNNTARAPPRSRSRSRSPCARLHVVAVGAWVSPPATVRRCATMTCQPHDHGTARHTGRHLHDCTTHGWSRCPARSCACVGGVVHVARTRPTSSATSPHMPYCTPSLDRDDTRELTCDAASAHDGRGPWCASAMMRM